MNRSSQHRKEVAAEVAALEADVSDQLEMLEVAWVMENLRATAGAR